MPKLMVITISRYDTDRPLSDIESWAEFMETLDGTFEDGEGTFEEVQKALQNLAKEIRNDPLGDPEYWI
jgi:hypothetical protein